MEKLLIRHKEKINFNYKLSISVKMMFERIDDIILLSSLIMFDILYINICLSVAEV